MRHHRPALAALLVTMAASASAQAPALGPSEAFPSAEAFQAALAAIEPLGPLPELTGPPDNLTTDAKVELGKMLFFDPRLSGNGTMPCSACHLPDVGWGTGGEISFGYAGTTHWRNSQTIYNVGHYNMLFWAGASPSLESQAPAAAHGAVAGNGDDSIMEMRLAFIPEYRAMFAEVFGREEPIINDAWRAIAAFQRTINSDPAMVPFDRYAAGDAEALSDSALRGWELFRGEAGCIACHNGPLVSNQRFYATGVPQEIVTESDWALQQITVRWQNYSKGVSEEIYYSDPGDLGLYYSTKRPEDQYKFRTPSLRELVYTDPYMHNGALATLADVVDFYAAGGGETPNKSPLLQPVEMSDGDKADLVAFLESLSSDEPILVDAPELPEIQPWR